MQIREAAPNFMNWYVHGVHRGEVDTTLVFFCSETFTTQWIHELLESNSFPMLIPAMSLHDVRFGLWCAVSATRIIGPTSFYESTDSRTYVTHILTPLFEYVFVYKKTRSFYQQQSESVNIENNYVCS
jgi:hypothetical protein